MNNCLFCNKSDDTKRPKNTDYVCGTCVVLILAYTREEREKACKFTEDCIATIKKSDNLNKKELIKRYDRKLNALKIFTKEGNYDGEQYNHQRNAEGCNDRIRVNEGIGSVETRTLPIEDRTRTPIHPD